MDKYHVIVEVNVPVYLETEPTPNYNRARRLAGLAIKEIIKNTGMFHNNESRVMQVERNVSGG